MAGDEFGAALAAMRTYEEGFVASLPSCWMQGRTAYGGASAALALAAVMKVQPDLPPLRSAQISFVGPLGGEIEIRPSLLRKGRSASFMAAELRSGGALGMAAAFLFASDRESLAEHLPPTLSELPGRGEPIQVPDEVAFAQNFHLAKAGRVGRTQPVIRRWAKLKDRSHLPPSVELMLVADVLPAAALKLLKRPGPISTMTWQLNLLTPAPDSSDGWWLVSAEANVAQAGFSTQSMGIWNSEGRPIATALQTVAIFA